MTGVISLYYFGTTLLRRHLSRIVICLKEHFKCVHLLYFPNSLVPYLMVYFMFWYSFCSKWLFTQKCQSNNDSVTVLRLRLVLQKCSTAQKNNEKRSRNIHIYCLSVTVVYI